MTTETRHRARRMTAIQTERVHTEISFAEGETRELLEGVTVGATFVEGTAAQLVELAELVEYHVDDDHAAEIEGGSMRDLSPAIVERAVAKRVESIEATVAKLRTAACSSVASARR